MDKALEAAKRYKKFLVTAANVLAVVAAGGVLDGAALKYAVLASALLTALGVRQARNAEEHPDDGSIPELTEDYQPAHAGE